jgi:hypothetical protein
MPRRPIERTPGNTPNSKSRPNDGYASRVLNFDDATESAAALRPVERRLFGPADSAANGAAAAAAGTAPFYTIDQMEEEYFKYKTVPDTGKLPYRNDTGYRMVTLTAPPSNVLEALMYPKDGDKSIQNMNAPNHLFRSLEEFKTAPDGIYVYGFFDIGFGALQVKNYSEFLMNHSALSRRLGATKVYAAGEIDKKGKAIKFNIASGTYSRKIRISPEAMIDFIKKQFANEGVVTEAGFVVTANTAVNKRGAPVSFITPESVPPLGPENKAYFESHGFTVSRRRRATRKRRTRRA